MWASVEWITGSERLEYEQLGARVTARFTVRWRPGIMPSMRLNYGAHQFIIREVADTKDAHVELILTCEELVVRTGAGS
jgi:SPP1 family predicted phage head-tail adaptor